MIRLTYIMIAVVLTTLISLQNANAHEYLMARFDIKAVQNNLALKISIDKQNLKYALIQECNQQNITSELITEYIRDHFTLTIDGIETRYSFDSIDMSNEFVLLNGQLITCQSDFRQMAVQNSCLIHTIDKHSNIIRVIAKDQSRSFRLHKDRQQTIIAY